MSLMKGASITKKRERGKSMVCAKKVETMLNRFRGSDYTIEVQAYLIGIYFYIHFQFWETIFYYVQQFRLKSQKHIQ